MSATSTTPASNAIVPVAIPHKWTFYIASIKGYCGVRAHTVALRGRNI